MQTNNNGFLLRYFMKN